MSEEETKLDNQTEDDIQDEIPLYYIYNNDDIQGPYEIDEIIKLWRTKQIKNGRMWIASSKHNKHEWYKIEFPQYIAKDLGKDVDEDDDYDNDVQQECMNRNKEIKSKFPKLYKILIENVANNELKPCKEPTDIPKEAKQATSKLKTATKLLGKSLMILIVIIILLHDFVTVCLGFCFRLPISWFCEPESLDKDNIIGMIFILISNCGMIITPLVTTVLILNETDMYNDGIQSWMISWILWGVLSYIVSLLYIYSGIMGNDRVSDLINNLVLLIIGVNIENSDLLCSMDIDDDAWRYVGLIFVYPSLACFMPAAISGFIANFALEEKFSLKCSDEIQNDYLCFEDKYGCCKIVSSHDVQNSYIFIGGLASNILAIWAIVRIIGYFIVNASDSLTLYAKRKK